MEGGEMARQGLVVQGQRFLMIIAASALALSVGPPRAFAGQKHSTPDNGKENVHKVFHNHLPKKHNLTTGLTDEQKHENLHPAGRERPIHVFSKDEQKSHEL